MKKFINYFGKLLMVLSIAFIVKQVISYDVDFSVIFQLNILIVFVICTIFQGINTFYASFIYNHLLRIVCKKKIDQKKVSLLYCKTDLYKYLPGNVMHFVGRNQIAVETGESHVDVALATLIEIVCLILGAGLVTVICVFNYLVSYIKLFEIDMFIIFAVGAVGFIIVIALFYIFRKKIFRQIEKHKFLFEKRNLFQIIIVVLKCILRLSVNAVAFILLMMAFGLVPDSAELLVLVFGFFIMSWLIGYVTPGAPGGIGVREFIMTVFLGAYFPESTLLTVVILYRVLCICTDIVSYLISLAYANFSKVKTDIVEE